MCSLIYFRTPSGVIVVIVALDDHARTSLQAEKQTTSCFQSVCVVCDDEHTRGGGGGGARRAHTTFGSGGAICHVSQPAPAVPNNKTCAHVCERNTRSRTRAELFRTKTTTKQHCALIACHGLQLRTKLNGRGAPAARRWWCVRQHIIN